MKHALKQSLASTAIASLLWGAVWIAPVSAGPISIPITNPSFEEPNMGPGGINSSITGWNNQNPVNVVFDPVGSSPFTSGGNAMLDAPADGDQVLVANFVGVDQTLTGVSLLPGKEYSLRVAVGNRNDTSATANFRVELFAGATSLGFAAGDAQTFAPDGGFATATVFYIAPLVGAPTGDLRIDLQFTDPYDFGGPRSAVFDNVQLEYVPEPSSTALVGFAACALLWRRKGNR